MTGPASWKGQRAGRLRPTPREIKMLQPRCDICQVGLDTARDWYLDCTHDPYVTVAAITREVPTYEDVVDDAGKPTGTKRAIGVERLVDYEVRPNWSSVTLSRGVNSGRGIDKKRRRGFILPEDLRNAAYPAGIKPRCQFRDCYAEDIAEYKNGWFCREREAQMVVLSEGEGQVPEVGFNAQSTDKLNAQLETAGTKVRL